uniref:Beclin-1 n=1 Tax=Strigamia maritima TaxID=126957 RepID=T1JKG5_STRMM
MAGLRIDAGLRDSTIEVNFLCQRCSQPIRLEPSFNYLDERVISELSDRNSRLSDISRKYVPPVRLTDSGNGFMMVGDTGGDNADKLSQHLTVMSELFDIVSEESEIDHPLCEECADALLDRMDQELKLKEDECKDYREFLDHLHATEEEDAEELEEELERFQAEEVELKKQLEKVELEQKELTKSLEQYQSELEQLEREEERHLHENCSHKRDVLLFEDEQRSIDNQLLYAQTQLQKLRGTNVFNATFHIWHNGHFGTINDFRLGRLPTVPVDWNEINAAWGQTVLLLHSLAKKLNLTFQRYRLVPYGNHSFLESLADNSKELPLYGSGGIRFFWDTKFDQAMVAFLDCLQQFKEEVEKGDKAFCLPYKMDKGRIEDSSGGLTYSIKIQFNSEEQWTKALKFMLTNLKWGLAWVSAQFK